MKPRRRGHRRRTHIDREVDLNITSFMNLMVVLVPFLLTTAVFSKMSVLSIDVPTPGNKPVDPSHIPPPPPDKAPFRLVVNLQPDGVVIVAGTQILPMVPRTQDGGYDTAKVREMLTQIKANRPDHAAIDIMSRPDSPYADLVQVMDADAQPDGTLLFPDVRLGELVK